MIKSPPSYGIFLVVILGSILACLMMQQACGEKIFDLIEHNVEKGIVFRSQNITMTVLTPSVSRLKAYYLQKEQKIGSTVTPKRIFAGEFQIDPTAKDKTVVVIPFSHYLIPTRPDDSYPLLPVPNQDLTGKPNMMGVWSGLEVELEFADVVGDFFTYRTVEIPFFVVTKSSYYTCVRRKPECQHESVPFPTSPGIPGAPALTMDTCECQPSFTLPKSGSDIATTAFRYGSNCAVKGQLRMLANNIDKTSWKEIETENQVALDVRFGSTLSLSTQIFKNSFHCIYTPHEDHSTRVAAQVEPGNTKDSSVLAPQRRGNEKILSERYFNFRCQSFAGATKHESARFLPLRAMDSQLYYIYSEDSCAAGRLYGATCPLGSDCAEFQPSITYTPATATTKSTVDVTFAGGGRFGQFKTNVNVFFRTLNNQLHIVPSTEFAPLTLKKGARVTLAAPNLPPGLDYEAIVSIGWDGPRKAEDQAAGSFDGCRWKISKTISIPPQPSPTAVSIGFAFTPIKQHAYNHQAIMIGPTTPASPLKASADVPPLLDYGSGNVYPFLPDDPSWSFGTPPPEFGYWPVISPLTVTNSATLRLFSRPENGPWVSSALVVSTTAVCPVPEAPSSRIIYNTPFGFGLSDWQSAWVAGYSAVAVADSNTSLPTAAIPHLFFDSAGASLGVGFRTAPKPTFDQNQVLLELPAASAKEVGDKSRSFQVGFSSTKLSSQCPKVPMEIIDAKDCPVNLPSEIKCYQRAPKLKNVDCLIPLDIIDEKYPIRELQDKSTTFKWWDSLKSKADRSLVLDDSASASLARTDGDKATILQSGHLHVYWNRDLKLDTSPVWVGGGVVFDIGGKCKVVRSDKVTFELVTKQDCPIFFRTNPQLEVTSSSSTSIQFLIRFASLPGTTLPANTVFTATESTYKDTWTVTANLQQNILTFASPSPIPTSSRLYSFSVKVPGCELIVPVQFKGAGTNPITNCPWPTTSPQTQVHTLTTNSPLGPFSFAYTPPIGSNLDDLSAGTHFMSLETGWTFSFSTSSITFSAQNSQLFTGKFTTLSFTLDFPSQAPCTTTFLVHLNPDCPFCATENTAECKQAGNSNQCICKDGFGGPDCSHPVGCKSPLCFNTNSCPPSGGQCPCLPPWGGDQCTCDTSKCAARSPGKWKCGSGSDCICDDGYSPPDICDDTSGCVHMCLEAGSLSCSLPCPCKKGFFGAQCRCDGKACPLNASCDPAGKKTDDCICDKGWEWDEEERECKKRVLCALGCEEAGTAFCDEGKSQCVCKPGWTGPTCSCGPTTCPHENSMCTEDGKCVCKAGFLPQPADVRPGERACHKETTCSDTCVLPGTAECDVQKCICEDPPFGGKTCACDARKCPPNQICDPSKLTDDCVCKQPGFTWLPVTKECDEVLPPPCGWDCSKKGTLQCTASDCICNPGWHGPHCEYQCICNGLNQECAPNNSNGACRCKDGFTTDMKGECTIPVGPPECVPLACSAAGTQSCDLSTGVCICKNGFNGPKCQCSDKDCGEHSVCSEFGTCVCAQGHWFDHDGKCQPTACELQYCAILGTESCPPKGGCNCRDGWTGKSCDCEEAKCKKDNSNHGQCDSESGQCKCEPGWRFPPPEGNCSMENACPGKQCNMEGTKQCGESDGPCICLPPWSGWNCSCMNCVGNATCDDATQSCLCSNLWEGSNCDSCKLQGLCKNGGKPNNICSFCDCKTGYMNPSPWQVNVNQYCQCKGASGKILLKAFNDIVIATQGIYQNSQLEFDGSRYELKTPSNLRKTRSNLSFNYLSSPSSSSNASDSISLFAPLAATQGQEQQLWAMMRDIYDGMLQVLVPTENSSRTYSYTLTPTGPNNESTIFEFKIPYGCPEANPEWTKLGDIQQPWADFMAQFAQIPQIKKYFRVSSTEDCNQIECEIDGDPLVPVSAAISNMIGFFVAVVVVVCSFWIVF